MYRLTYGCLEREKKLTYHDVLLTVYSVVLKVFLQDDIIFAKLQATCFTK
jgi:hypothetical protein